MTPVFTIITRTNTQAGEQAVESGDQTVLETRPANQEEPLLSPIEVTVYSLIGFSCILLLILMVYLWLRAKSRSTEQFLVNQEKEFEREILKEFGPHRTKRVAASADASANAAAAGSLNDTQLSPSAAESQPIAPGASSPAPTVAQPSALPSAPSYSQTFMASAGASAPLLSPGGRTDFDALAGEVCRRLEVAGVLQSREGPFLLSDSDTRGQMIKLRGDRLALIIGDWESEKFYLRQLKRFEVIFVVRDAENVTVLQPFSRYLGGQVEIK